MDGDTNTIPGGRREGEPAKAFEAFTVYREMGPSRSLTKVAQELRKHRPQITEWSARWGWVERCAEWDDYADMLSRQRDLAERAESVRRMNERHAKIGSEALDVAARKLETLAPGNTPKERAAAKVKLDALGVGEAARLMSEGAKLERLARGETTERLEVREAQKWVERMIPIAMTYIPEDSHEAFLTDIEAVLGMGSGLSAAPEE